MTANKIWERLHDFYDPLAWDEIEEPPRRGTGQTATIPRCTERAGA